MQKELSTTYDPKQTEEKLYQKWIDKGYFHAEVDKKKKPFTIVIPPPNITGQLHLSLIHIWPTAFGSMLRMSCQMKRSNKCAGS